MIRHIAPTLTGLLAATFACCDKGGATERQREGQANGQLAQARNEASQWTLSAQAAANIAAARADFEKTREAYRHARAADLTDLDKKIAEREAKENVSNDETEAQLQAAPSVVREKVVASARDMSTLDNATASAWDEGKAKTGRGEWDALKSAVDKAR